MIRIRHIIIVLAAVCCMLPASLHGQAVATLADDTIALGDQTTLSIRNALNYPSADMLSTGGIVALSQTFDTATRTQHTVITSFEPGEHFIHLSSADSLPLVVTDVAIDTATMEPRDIMPLERVPYTFWEIFRWVLLALAIAAIAFGVWWMLTHRKQLQQVLGISEPVDTRTPEERALQRLDALRDSKLWQAGKVKEYHTELTDAVRLFIEETTAIRATELTSDETIDELDKWTINIDVAPLREIFATADLVKFAKSEPLPHVHERSMSLAVDFVKAMWQQVKPKEEEAPNE